ncbi:hypothetical protein M9434_002471 [Picochlorum sp. BPE23]|nr:hypothetical protein M9434_002471 [Picochlorum sp. BPE23]
MSHLEAEIYDIAIRATHLKELAPRHRTTCAPAVVTGHLVYCAKFGPVSIGCTGPLPKRIVVGRLLRDKVEEKLVFENIQGNAVTGNELDYQELGLREWCS